MNFKHLSMSLENYLTKDENYYEDYFKMITAPRILKRISETGERIALVKDLPSWLIANIEDIEPSTYRYLHYLAIAQETGIGMVSYDEFINPQDDKVKVSIYQIDTEKNEDALFRDYKWASEHDGPDLWYYKKVYTSREDSANLDKIYEKFNINQPKDYRGHSLSISDIIVIEGDNPHAYYVNTYDFVEVPNWLAKRNHFYEMYVEIFKPLYLKSWLESI